MWKRKGRIYVFMDEANAGEGGGAGAGAGSAPAGGAEGGSPTGAAAEGGAAGSGGTALEAGGQGQGQQHFIPEKYLVKAEDGTIDLEGSAKKLSEAHLHLEKRMGSGDMPPKSAEDYQITVPDALKDVWNPKEDALLGEFLKSAHAAGMNQKQIDLAMATYMDVIPKLLDGSKQLSTEECTATLRETWKTDEQYKEAIQQAYKAAIAYGDSDAEAIIKDYGNDPRIIKLLNRIGAELSEDGSITPPGGGIPQGQTAESLMMSEAYNNPKHPEHAAVSRQVAAHFEAMAKQAAKSGNVPVM